MASIVIVGASHAGVQLAASLREANYDGDVTLITDDAQIPYHRPPLSKAFLKDENQDVQVLRAEEFFEEHNIKLIKPVRVERIDRQASSVELSDGSNISYDQLILTTGARPRPLDIPGIGSDGIYELRDHDDAHRLRDAAKSKNKAVVVGGGFIGLEAAATLKHLGLDVTVVEAAPRLLGRVVAPEISQFVYNRFSELGIDVHLNTPISEIKIVSEEACGIKCGETEFDADMVLIGIGVIPNIELAEQAGLEVENGIVVDDQFRTSDPNIYAIGDVCNYEHWQTGTRVRLESVQNATDQAKNLADTLMGNARPYDAVPWFWSDQADMKIQMVGLSINSYSVVTRENKERGNISAFHYDKDGNLVAIDSINAPADHMAGRKLIADGITPTPEQAADPDFRLKTLMG